MGLIRMDSTMISIVLFFSITSDPVLGRVLRDSSELPSVAPGAFSGIDNKTVTVNQIADRNTLILLSVVILEVLVLFYLWYKYVNTRPSEPSENEESNPENPQGWRTYTVEELTVATQNFSSLVGEGASASVYRADLPGNVTGAVKKFKKACWNLFETELSVLLRLPRHPHLVNLIGMCSKGVDRMLVFEFVANGTLFSRLHESQGVAGPLSWASRKMIARQVAEALRHLNEVARPPIIHRDVKSQNVLLQDDSYAKLADFGVAKLGPKDNGSTNTNLLCGTRGYMDPQYAVQGSCSAKSDVYSFGVLLLELITGSKAVIGETALVDCTRKARLSEEKNSIISIVHPSLLDPNDEDEQLKMIRIANGCLKSERDDRPSMVQVVEMMDGIINA